MTNRTSAPAEERALYEHVRSLRKVKFTFNEDQIWVLYRLLVAERRDDTPSVMPELPLELDHAMGMALAQLSDAHLDLNAPKEGDV